MSASATTMSTQKVPVLPLKKRRYDMSLFQADGDQCRTVTQILVCPVQKPSCPSSKRRKRRHTFTKEEQKVLEDVFSRKHYPALHEIIRLSVELGIPEATVKIWFQNKRMKIKGGSVKNGKIQSKCDGGKDGRTPGQMSHQVPSPDLHYDNTNTGTTTMNIRNCGVYTNSSTTDMSVRETSRISPGVAQQKKHKYCTRQRKHLYDQAKESDHNAKVDSSYVITKDGINKHHKNSPSVDNNFVSNSRGSEQSCVNMTRVTESVSEDMTQLHSKPDKYICMLNLKDRDASESRSSRSTPGRNFTEKCNSVPNHCGDEGMNYVLCEHQNKPVVESQKWNNDNFCQGNNQRNIDLSFHDNFWKGKKCNGVPGDTCKHLQNTINKNVVEDASYRLQRRTHVALKGRAKRSVVEDTSKLEDTMVQSGNDVNDVKMDAVNEVLQMRNQRNVDGIGTKDTDNILKRQEQWTIDTYLTEDIDTMIHKKNDLTVDSSPICYREIDLIEIANSLQTRTKPIVETDNNVIEDTLYLLQSKNKMNADSSVQEDSNSFDNGDPYHRLIHRKFTKDVGDFQQNRKQLVTNKNVFEHMYNLPERRDKDGNNVIKDTIDLPQRLENCNRNMSSEITFHTINCNKHLSDNHVNNFMRGFSQTFYQHKANSAFQVMFSSEQSIWPYWFQASDRISTNLNRWQSTVNALTSNVFDNTIPTSNMSPVYPEHPGTRVCTFSNLGLTLCNVQPCVSSSAEKTLPEMPDLSCSIKENSCNDITACRQGRSISNVISPEVSAQQSKSKQSSAKTCLVNSSDTYWPNCSDMSTSTTSNIGHQTQVYPTRCSAKLPSFLELISGVSAFSNRHLHVKNAPSILKNSNDVDPKSSILKNSNIVAPASNLFKTPDTETRASPTHRKPDIVATASSILRKPGSVAPASPGLKNPDSMSPVLSGCEQTEGVTPGSFVPKKADLVAPVFTSDESLALDRNTLSPCITPPSFDIFDNCINTDLQVDSPCKPPRNFLITEDDGMIGHGLHFCCHYRQQY